MWDKVPEGKELFTSKEERKIIYSCPKCGEILKEHKQKCKCGLEWKVGLIMGFYTFIDIERKED